MEFVIDANVIFAALIKDGKSIELIAEPNVVLFAPDFIFEEFLEHKDEILAKTKRQENEFYEIIDQLKEKIITVKKVDFENYIEIAKTFSPDVDDTFYLALALKLAIPIWSNDKELKEKQNIIKVYNTKEVCDLIINEI